MTKNISKAPFSQTEVIFTFRNNSLVLNQANYRAGCRLVRQLGFEGLKNKRGVTLWYSV
jgi:hypothetical protein